MPKAVVKRNLRSGEKDLVINHKVKSPIIQWHDVRVTKEEKKKIKDLAIRVNLFAKPLRHQSSIAKGVIKLVSRDMDIFPKGMTFCTKDLFGIATEQAEKGHTAESLFLYKVGHAKEMTPELIQQNPFPEYEAEKAAEAAQRHMLNVGMAFPKKSPKENFIFILETIKDAWLEQ